jgi:ATP-dependent RNA helicase DeaD
MDGSLISSEFCEGSTNVNSFDELKLSPPLAKALAEMGFTAPTPIQAATLPLLLGKGTDFLGMAATGTGKTGAFGIPLLETIEPSDREPQALVMCPTRELAVQVAEQISLLGKYKGINVQCIYGGAGYKEQIMGLRRGAHVIVATPGRLVDHMTRGTVSLESVRTIVLDEADEMISMGFKEELETVLKQVPMDASHRWFFAATMSPALRAVADTYLRTPQSVRVNRTEMLPGTVQQFYYTVREKNKPKGVMKLIDNAESFYGLIFCQTKVVVIGLTEYLKSHGYSVDCLHGDKSQMERERVLKNIKDRTVNIVVCSDVAARGLDVKDLTHVINYSLPHDFDSYIHRIGRTGRSGSAGTAMNLVTPSQMHMVDRLQRMTRTVMQPAIFPTRKDISAKKLAQLLPKFLAAPHQEKAMEILGEDWKATIEATSKEEIVARFLGLQYPELFAESETEKAEEIGFAEREEEPRRRPYQRSGDRGDRGGSFDRRPRSGGFRSDNSEGGGFRGGGGRSGGRGEYRSEGRSEGFGGGGPRRGGPGGGGRREGGFGGPRGRSSNSFRPRREVDFREGAAPEGAAGGASPAAEGAPRFAGAKRPPFGAKKKWAKKPFGKKPSPQAEA